MGFLAELFIRGFLKGFFQYLPPHPHHIVVSLNPRQHDMKTKKHESTLPEKAFTQVTAFLAEWFLR